LHRVASGGPTGALSCACGLFGGLPLHDGRGVARPGGAVQCSAAMSSTARIAAMLVY
jgi:hypothetical protein